jgi:cytochrome c-type biogenesis protein CcmH/NrfG
VTGRGWAGRLAVVGAILAITGSVVVGRSLDRRAESNAATRVSLASLGIGSKRSSDPPHERFGAVDPAVESRLDSLQRALAENPTDDAARIRLARHLEASHQLPGALEHYREHLRRVPDDADAWLDLGRVLSATGDIEGAEAATKAVLALDPANGSALYNMGAIAANLGRRDEAETWWGRAIVEAAGTAAAERAASSLKRISDAS